MRLEFFVAGMAKPAGSKSAFRHPQTGRIIVTHANAKTKDWMDSVRWFAMQVTNRMVPWTEPVRLSVVFLKHRPQNHYGSGRNEGTLKSSAPEHDTTVPDLTKLTRAVEDALTGIVWKDDKQVVEQHTNKRYCRGDEKPGAQILIETLDERKEVHYGKEESHKSRTGSLFESAGREGGDNGHHQPARDRLPQGQDLLHSPVSGGA